MDTSQARPFISTPLPQPTENGQMMQTPMQPDQRGMQPMMPSPMPTEMEDMESMYPEIYRDLYPIVMAAVNSLILEGYTLTPGLISNVVDSIIKNSGLWYEDEDDDQYDMMPEAMPAQMGFGRTPYRRRMRRHHNRDTLRDVVRILLLRELFSNRTNFPHFMR